nr:hypothetical protein [Chloroflexota bacterium]
MYDTERYFILTGHVLPGYETVEDRANVLVDLHRRVFGDSASPPPRDAESTLSMDDEDVLKLAFRAENGDRIRRLYGGDTTGYR